MPCPRRAGPYRSCVPGERVPAALLDPGAPSQPRPLWHEPMHRHEDCRAAAGEPSSSSQRGRVTDACYFFLLSARLLSVRVRWRVNQPDAASAVVTGYSRRAGTSDRHGPTFNQEVPGSIPDVAAKFLRIGSAHFVEVFEQRYAASHTTSS